MKEPVSAVRRLAFGRGRHLCPGVFIALLEATLIGLPTLHVAAAQTLKYARVMSGAILERLVVEWD